MNEKITQQCHELRPDEHKCKLIMIKTSDKYDYSQIEVCIKSKKLRSRFTHY